MGNNKHHHKVSSFNPAWCLGPPRIKPTTTRNINNGNKSPLPPTTYRSEKSHHHHRRRHHHNRELTVEPTSPRVGCMGQIRQCKAPKGATGSVHSSSSSSRASCVSPQFNLLMLKRGASGSANASASASPSSITGEFSLLMLRRLPVEEMDPPRPVERKEAKPENSVSLWKRRRCRDGLQLKLQPMEQLCN